MKQNESINERAKKAQEFVEKQLQGYDNSRSIFEDMSNNN